MQHIETKSKAFDTVRISVSTSFAAGTPIKVVSERLGHSHPGFTMATHQHLVPGMSATAAHDFANLIATHRDQAEDFANLGW